MSSSDLVNLAQMDGKMQWLAGYGNVSRRRLLHFVTLTFALDTF